MMFLDVFSSLNLRRKIFLFPPTQQGLQFVQLMRAPKMTGRACWHKDCPSEITNPG
jgi:hypothetical protein